MWIESANKKILVNVTSIFVVNNKLKATELANSTDDIDLGEYEDETTALRVKDYVINAISQGLKFVSILSQEEVETALDSFGYIPTDEDLRLEECTEIPI